MVRPAVRYRLRFHLQEVDLTTDEVVIGRGSTCQVTIDDPMLSRRHVKISLARSTPSVEDLRSRNGTQLNGRPLTGRATLQDGDRIRIGTQELVFLAAGRIRTDLRTTSGLTFCIGCAVPYPSTSPQCPHCGAVRTAEGEGAATREAPATGWTFHLLSQVVERALAQGRLADAERMLSRGVSELQEQLDAGLEVESGRVADLAECSGRLGCDLRSRRWLEISAKLYERADDAPSHDLLSRLNQLPIDESLGAAIEALRHAEERARRAG